MASLHQAVGERLPSRADFYAPWLHSESLRTPRVSVAGIRAALSFLRLEDAAYDPTVRRAGELAATWTWQRLSAPRRAWLRLRPTRGRARAAGRLLQALARDTWEDTRLSARWRRGRGTITIASSLFCSVRGRVAHPLCGYYAAALQVFLRELAVDAAVDVAECAACGDGSCVLKVEGGVKSGGGGVATAGLAVLLTASVVVARPAFGQSLGPGDPASLRPIVMPFERPAPDAGLAWLGEGGAILVTDALRASGVAALTRDERMRALERLEVPPLAALSLATVLRIGLLVGASDVVVGRFEVEGDRLIVRARRVRLDQGQRDPEVVRAGPKSDFVDLFRQVAGDLFGPIEARAAESAGTVVPAAFELYVKGLIAGSMPAQVTLLQGALKAHPGYDAPRLALWQVFTANGDHAAAREALRAVGAESARYLEAQFLTTVSLAHLGQYDEAAALLTRLHAKEPAGEFLNNLGVLALRRSQPVAGQPPASTYFRQAHDRDPGDVDYLYNLGYACWREGRHADAVSALREAVRMDPSDGGAHALFAQVLEATSQTAEARRELELARRLSSEFDDLDLGAAAGAVVPRRMARLKTEYGVRRERSIDVLLAAAGQQGQQETARHYLDQGRRFYLEERDREAERELDRAVYLSPYDPDAHLLLGRVYLRTGRVREAIDALKISVWCDETVEAQVALAEALIEGRDEAAARAALQRALAIEPEHEGALRLLERISRHPMPPAV